MVKKINLFLIWIIGILFVIAIGFSSWVFVGEQKAFDITTNVSDIFSNFVNFTGITITPYNNIGFIHKNEETINQIGIITIQYSIDLEACKNYGLIKTTATSLNLRLKLSYGSGSSTNINIFTNKIFTKGEYFATQKTIDNVIVGDSTTNSFETIVSSESKEVIAVTSVPINYQEGIISKYLYLKINYVIDFSSFPSFNDSIFIPLTKEEMNFNAEVCIL